MKREKIELEFRRFANANISAFYSCNAMNNRYASIALKLSAGANLYINTQKIMKL